MGLTSSMSEGATELHHASAAGNLESIRELLNSGEDVNAKDENDLTPLHYASWNGCVSALRLLIENGARINNVNKSGQSSLHYAASQGHIQIINTLLISGADSNLKDKKRRTAQDIAQENNYERAAYFLKSGGLDHTGEAAVELSDFSPNPIATRLESKAKNCGIDLTPSIPRGSIS